MGNPARRHPGTHRLGTAVMVSIGAGPHDPRAWVRAARKLIEAAETAGPGDKLRLVPGHGYYPGTRS
jgi:hypothetical protein